MKYTLLSKIIRSRLYLLFFILIFTGLLSIFGIKGIYSRYAQDDYCYGYRVWENGFWKNQVDSYFQLTEYSSNRYSLTLFNNIAEVLGGPRFVPYLPSLEIIVWGFSLIYLISHLLKPLKYSVFLSTLAALVILFFTFYLSPNPYQNLYWLSAIQPYLTPLVLTTFILGRILHFTTTTRFTVLNVLKLGFLSLLAGGFSETTAVWQFSIWIIVLLWVFFFQRNTLFQRAKWPVTTVLVSTFLAIVILIICPTNSIKASNFEHPGFLSTIAQSLLFGEEFIRTSIKAAPIPFAVIFFYGFWLGALAIKRNIFAPYKYLLYLITTIIILYLLSMATMLPYLYAMGEYPGDRALFPAHFTLIFGLFAIGWILAKSISAIWVKVESTEVTRVFLAILGIMLFVYTARTSFLITVNLDKFHARAKAWDIRQ